MTHEDENAFLLEILYTIFNREACERVSLDERLQQVQIRHLTKQPGTEPTVPEVIAPESIDLRHCAYTVMDGLYHAYLMVPSSGFNSRVVAGLSLIHI